MNITAKIRKTNNEFKQANAAKKRMMIACDVLKSLRAGILDVTRGTYCMFYDHEDTETVEDYFMAEKQCTACAIGSMFLANVLRRKRASKVALTNDFECHDRLERYFSRLQLGLIESAFEMQNMVSGMPTTPDIDGAIEFGQNYPNNDQRLEAIMENIIANKGEFKP